MLEAGKQGPDFRLRTLDGSQVSLSELTRTGPVLVVFYKVSCPVCQLTIPFLERIRENGRIRIVAVSQDGAEATLEFNKAFRVNLETVVDPAGEGYAASNAYRISQVPTAFQVEPAGVISHAWMGFSKADMEALGERAGMAVFKPGEKVPVFRPG